MNPKPVQGLLKIKPIIAWLKTQPRAKRYDYLDNENCLLCQYIKAHGHMAVHAGGYDITVSDVTYPIPPSLISFPTKDAGATTFGAALKRAMKIAAR